VDLVVAAAAVAVGVVVADENAFLVYKGGVICLYPVCGVVSWGVAELMFWGCLRSVGQRYVDRYSGRVGEMIERVRSHPNDRTPPPSLPPLSPPTQKHPRRILH